MSTTPTPLALASPVHPTLAITSLEDMDRVSKSIAASGMFGVTKPEQALCLMLLCQAEGMNPIAALRRYHIIEGKPSMRADAMQGEFEARGGGIIWHTRTDSEVAATFFSDRKQIDAKATDRAKARYAALRDGDTKTASELAEAGEETIIRTIADVDAKKVSMSWDRDKGAWKKKHNWQQSPRQMLTARTITEGVRLIMPGLIAGICSPDELEDAKTTTEPPSEVDAIRAIIAQHLADAEHATPSERKRLYGLASELRCRLQELGEDVTPIEQLPDALDPLPGATYVQPNEPKTEVTTVTDHAPEVLPPEDKKTPEPASDPADWKAVTCHIGTAGGKVLGYTMGQLFVDAPLKKAVAIMKWFKDDYMVQCEKVPNLGDKDGVLYNALLHAEHHVADRQKEGK